MKLTLLKETSFEQTLSSQINRGIRDVTSLLNAIESAEQADLDYAYALELSTLKEQINDLINTLVHTQKSLS